MERKLRIDVEKPEPLYIIVKKRILDLIESGDLKNNDRIPSEEIIAKKNNISRWTVRHALKELEKEGLIKRYPKRGTFVTLTPKESVKKNMHYLQNTKRKAGKRFLLWI